MIPRSASVRRDTRTGRLLKTGSGPFPFTQLLDENSDGLWYAVSDDAGAVQIPWVEEEINRLGTVKLVVRTIGRHRCSACYRRQKSAVPDRAQRRETVTAICRGFNDLLTPTQRGVVHGAIAANKLLFVAGWDRDADGNYVRPRFVQQLSGCG